jgi:hypothetical protein
MGNRIVRPAVTLRRHVNREQWNESGPAADDSAHRLFRFPRNERRSFRASRTEQSAGERRRDITRRFLMNVVLPVWLAAGIADWLCHRASSIETTTGPKESIIHLLMLTEAAVPVLCGMFLEITSPILALMIVAVLLHDATALWDVGYAVTMREVTPIEQHVHSFLEVVPVMAVAFVSVLHWPQLLALLGIGRDRPDWSIRWKRRPLPLRYTLGMLAAQVALEWLPYLEELGRTVLGTRAKPRRRRLAHHRANALQP